MPNCTNVFSATLFSKVATDGGRSALRTGWSRRSAVSRVCRRLSARAGSQRIYYTAPGSHSGALKGGAARRPGVRRLSQILLISLFWIQDWLDLKRNSCSVTYLCRSLEQSATSDSGSWGEDAGSSVEINERWGRRWGVRFSRSQVPNPGFKSLGAIFMMKNW